MEVPDDMQKAGQEFLAEEHAEQKRVDAKVEAMNEANAPEAPPSSPAASSAPPPAPDAAAKAQTAQLQAMAVLVEKVLPYTGVILWGAIDLAVQKFAGKEYALTADDRATLVAGTQPVINKYMPQDLLKFLETPEGLAVGTIVFVYGVKFAQVQGVPLFGLLPGAAPSSPPATTPEQPLEQKPSDTVTPPASVTLPTLQEQPQA